MTTMNKKDLVELGFNNNEAEVYCALASYGRSDANQIIRKTKFHKNIVYDNLNKLIDKGLVTFINEKSRRVFILAPGKMLVKFIEDQNKDIEIKMSLAQSISKDIEKIQKTIVIKQEVQVFRGKNGIRSFFERTLNGGDFYVFGAPKESVNIMEEHFWKNFSQKRIENSIKAKMIFNESVRSFAKELMDKNTQIRFFDKEFEPLTETHIQDDFVAIIVWIEEPILTLIQDINVAKSHKKYFEDMWQKARK